MVRPTSRAPTTPERSNELLGFTQQNKGWCMTLSTSTLGNPAIKALRFSESRYRRLFETAQDGILLLNAEIAQIEDVNPYLITMPDYYRNYDDTHGKSSSAMAARTFRDICSANRYPLRSSRHC
jgi:PAS domain-containing protein